MSMFTPVGEGGQVKRTTRTRVVGRRLVGVVLALSLITAGGVVAWRFAFRSEPDRQACPSSPASQALKPAAVSRPQQIVVNVYNATKRNGLAGRTAKQLRDRGFAVRKVANDPLERHVPAAAEIRAGAIGARHVRVVQAHVAGARAVRDARADASVDVVLGEAFRALRPPAQAQALLSRDPKASAANSC